MSNSAGEGGGATAKLVVAIFRVTCPLRAAPSNLRMAPLRCVR
jgi:hypothetical protein